MPDPMLEREVAARLRSLLSENQDLANHIQQLLKLGEGVVFGGWVRDTLHTVLHGEVLPSRDFDIVVQGTLLGTSEAELNHFGGRRLRLPAGLAVDCWELSRTLAFTRGLLEPSLLNLLRSTVYRLNGCSMDVRTFRLQSAGAIEDIRARRISFNCTGYLDVYPEYQAFRAIDLAERLQYELDDEVAEFVAATLQKAKVAGFAQEVREHRRDESTERLERLFRKFAT